MPDCIFCKIINGKIPCDKVYENLDILAFLDINPVNKGHLLIIPKKHYQWMYDVPDEVLSKVFVKSKYLMKSLKESMKADYVALSVVGVDIPHFHVHLVPRYKNDGMKDFWPTRKYENNEGKETAEKIKKYL